MGHRLVALVLLAGCGKKADEPPKPGPAATPADAAVKPDATVDAALADDKVPVPGKDQALLLAEEPGGTIEIELDDGTVDKLPDDTVVDVTPLPPDSKASGFHVTAGGKHGHVDSERAAQDVFPDPTGKLAVVRLEDNCGDVCFGPVWLLRGTRQRWKLFDSAVTSRVAWGAGKVAVDDTRDTVIVQLPSGMIERRIEGFLSPAYAPDGTLYLRDLSYGVFTVGADGKPKKVGKTKNPSSGPPEEGTYDPGPDPVTFDAAGKWKEPKWSR